MEWKESLALLLERLESWKDEFVTHLPNLAVALVVAALFGFLSGPISRLCARLTHKGGATQAIGILVSSIVRVAVLLLGVTIALGILGLDKTVYSLLAGAGVVGIALGFAFQDLASNLIAGVAMGVRKPFHVGDMVETNGFLGSVEKLNLRNTLVRTFDGQIVVIPNKKVFENPLVNYSMTGKRRIEVGVGVTYETDLEEASKIAREAIGGLDFVLEDEPIQALALEFGESSIDLSVRYWIDVRGEVLYPDARSAGVVAVHRAFGEHGVEIPFPIRTLDLERAREVLLETHGERNDADGDGGSEADRAGRPAGSRAPDADLDGDDGD